MLLPPEFNKNWKRVRERGDAWTTDCCNVILWQLNVFIHGYRPVTLWTHSVVPVESWQTDYFNTVYLMICSVSRSSISYQWQEYFSCTSCCVSSWSSPNSLGVVGKPILSLVIPTQWPHAWRAPGRPPINLGELQLWHCGKGHSWRCGGLQQLLPAISRPASAWGLQNM